VDGGHEAQQAAVVVQGHGSWVEDGRAEEGGHAVRAPPAIHIAQRLGWSSRGKCEAAPATRGTAPLEDGDGACEHAKE
jgi:hypothetical protein